MLRHDHLPIWLNRSRARFLRRIRTDLEAYYGSVSYEAFPFRVVEGDEAALLRESLEPRLRRCRRIVRATGRVSLLRLAPGELAGDVTKVNLMDVIFELDKYNLGKDDVITAIAAAEQAYDEGKPGAWLRTFNPLFWLDLALNYLEQLPFLPLRLFGASPTQAASTPLGQAVRIAVRLSALVALGLGVIMAVGLMDETLAWAGRWYPW